MTPEQLVLVFVGVLPPTCSAECNSSLLSISRAACGCDGKFKTIITHIENPSTIEIVVDGHVDHVVMQCLLWGLACMRESWHDLEKNRDFRMLTRIIDC